MKNIHEVQVTFEDKISEKLIIIWRIILRLKKFHMQLMNIMLWMSQARHIEIQITQTFTPLFFIKSDSNLHVHYTFSISRIFRIILSNES